MATTSEHLNLFNGPFYLDAVVDGVVNNLFDDVDDLQFVDGGVADSDVQFGTNSPNNDALFRPRIAVVKPPGDARQTVVIIPQGASRTYGIAKLDADASQYDVFLFAKNVDDSIQAGDLILIHETTEVTLADPVLADTAYSLGAVNIGSAIVRDTNGLKVNPTNFTVDKAAGEITFPSPLDLSAYTQPLVVTVRVQQYVRAGTVELEPETLPNPDYPGPRQFIHNTDWEPSPTEFNPPVRLTDAEVNLSNTPGRVSFFAGFQAHLASEGHFSAIYPYNFGASSYMNVGEEYEEERAAHATLWRPNLTDLYSEVFWVGTFDGYEVTPVIPGGAFPMFTHRVYKLADGVGDASAGSDVAYSRDFAPAELAINDATGQFAVDLDRDSGFSLTRDFTLEYDKDGTPTTVAVTPDDYTVAPNGGSPTLKVTLTVTIPGYTSGATSATVTNITQASLGLDDVNTARVEVKSGSPLKTWMQFFPGTEEAHEEWAGQVAFWDGSDPTTIYPVEAAANDPQRRAFTVTLPDGVALSSLPSRNQLFIRPPQGVAKTNFTPAELGFRIQSVSRNAANTYFVLTTPAAFLPGDMLTFAALDAQGATVTAEVTAYNAETRTVTVATDPSLDVVLEGWFAWIDETVPNEATIDSITVANGIATITYAAPLSEALPTTRPAIAAHTVLYPLRSTVNGMDVMAMGSMTGMVGATVRAAKASELHAYDKMLVFVESAALNPSTIIGTKASDGSDVRHDELAFYPTIESLPAVPGASTPVTDYEPRLNETNACAFIMEDGGGNPVPHGLSTGDSVNVYAKVIGTFRETSSSEVFQVEQTLCANRLIVRKLTDYIFYACPLKTQVAAGPDEVAKLSGAAFRVDAEGLNQDHSRIFAGTDTLNAEHAAPAFFQPGDTVFESAMYASRTELCTLEVRHTPATVTNSEHVIAALGVLPESSAPVPFEVFPIRRDAENNIVNATEFDALYSDLSATLYAADIAEIKGVTLPPISTEYTKAMRDAQVASILYDLVIDAIDSGDDEALRLDIESRVAENFEAAIEYVKDKLNGIERVTEIPGPGGEDDPIVRRNYELVIGTDQITGRFFVAAYENRRAELPYYVSYLKTNAEYSEPFIEQNPAYVDPPPEPTIPNPDYAEGRSRITLSLPLLRSYAEADETYVSAVHNLEGTLKARIVIGTQDSDRGRMNPIFPPSIRNDSAIRETWTIKFVSPTNYELFGAELGYVASGTTSSDFEPLNPKTGFPYFTIPALAWGSGGWANNDTVSLESYAGKEPVIIRRAVEAGGSPAGAQSAEIAVIASINSSGAII